MNLKKIKPEDREKRVLSLYLHEIGNSDGNGKYQHMVYKYIIYCLRHKSFAITTKEGVSKNMPDFENMESFGYNLLKQPLESLIISYPIEGLEEVVERIPEEEFSEVYSPSFSDMEPIEKEVEDAPGIIDSVADTSEIKDPIIKTELPKELIEIEKKVEKEIEKQNTTPILSTIVKGIESLESFDHTPTFKLKPEIIKPIITAMVEDPPQPPQKQKRCPNGERRNKQTGECEKIKKTIKGGSKISRSIEDDDGKGSLYITPEDLTGKIGLKRMMKYVDTLQLKGNFEYRTETLKNYGRIFAYDKIGNFSIKIKSILDNIYNPSTEKTSEGIILIYSQYIDSGLIPMALALEEYGFTRYGTNKSLFKESSEKKRSFITGKYCMITGETRISPNNEEEVKILTNENNKEGQQVKVVLISKAGSEGIDFKYIRQVHILEPWYNMNRIEQVIGRAVRNFSHKDLEFEKRNVQIFMHGTILENNKEEAADLYVYRVAEFKAIQIGKITRILKETAVDCIVNHAQTNFTQLSMNKPVMQILSNGMELDKFNVGDAPFSPSCDYMAECNYNCNPSKDFTEDELLLDTYSENFVTMNAEKILQRIRMLMKEAFFYKKESIIKFIRAQKEYPLIQIYAALTKLIEDETEFITDKYNRNGRLINVGNYYLFQPLELTDKKISMFDRSVPLDYKHSNISIKINKEKVKEKQQNPLHMIKENKSKQILDEIKANYEISQKYSRENIKINGKDDWYKQFGNITNHIIAEFPYAQDYITEALFSHMIEMLLFEDKLELMNYIYSLDSQEIQEYSPEWYIKKYIVQNTITTNEGQIFLMYKLNEQKIMILQEGKWEEIRKSKKETINEKLKEKLKLGKTNDIIGFIGYTKDNTSLTFKTKESKDMFSKRNNGARCDESGKANIIKKLNKILGEEKYTSENTKKQNSAIGDKGLCIIQEFILRYFQSIKKDKKNKKDDKKWFLTPELALFHEIYTIR
jgi:hypothetical protein